MKKFIPIVIAYIIIIYYYYNQAEIRSISMIRNIGSPPREIKLQKAVNQVIVKQNDQKILPINEVADNQVIDKQNEQTIPPINKEATPISRSDDPRAVNNLSVSNKLRIKIDQAESYASSKEFADRFLNVMSLEEKLNAIVMLQNVIASDKKMLSNLQYSNQNEDKKKLSYKEIIDANEKQLEYFQSMVVSEPE